MRRLEPDELIQSYGEILEGGAFLPSHGDPSLLAAIGRRCAVTVWGESIEPDACLTASVLWRSGPTLTFFVKDVEGGAWPERLPRAHVEARLLDDEGENSLTYFGAAAVVDDRLMSLTEDGEPWFDVARDADISADTRNDRPWREALLVAQDGLAYSTEVVEAAHLARAATQMGHVAGAPMAVRFTR